MNCIKDILRQLDNFGVDYGFTYNYKKKYTSAIGGFIFLAMVLGLIITLFINGISFIKREEFTSVIYDQKLYQAEEISFTNFGSIFGFSMYAYNTDTTPEMFEKLNKYLSINVQQIDLTRDSQGNIDMDFNKLKYRPCEEKDVPGLEAEYHSTQLKDCQCIEFDDYTIRGIYTDLKFQVVSVEVVAKNYEENAEEMIKFFKDHEIIFSIYLIEKSFDLYDYKDPIKRFLTNSVYFPLSSESFYEYNLYFKTMDFTTDNNWLINNAQPKKHLTYDYAEGFRFYTGEERFETKVQSFDHFLTVYLRSSLNKSIVERRYKKISEFLAEQTSIFEKLLLVGAFAGVLINEYLSYNALISQFYSFTSDNKDNYDQKIYEDIKKFVTSNKIQDVYKRHPEILIYEKNEKEEKEEIKKDKKQKPGIGRRGANGPNAANHSNPSIKEETEMNDVVSEGGGVTYGEVKKSYSDKASNAICSHMCPFFCKRKSDYASQTIFHAIESNLFMRMDVRYYLKHCQLVDFLIFIVLSDKRTSSIHFLANPQLSFGNMSLYNGKWKTPEKYFNIRMESVEKYIKELDTLVDKEDKSKLDEKYLILALRELHEINKRGNLLAGKE